MGDREPYTGNSMAGVDGKSRVGVPAHLRHALEKNGDGRVLSIALHPRDRCLIAFDSGWNRAMVARLREDEAADRASGGVFDRANTNRLAYGALEEVAYDANGRFILPGFFKHEAGIGQHALFIGTGDVFEIWDPSTLIAEPGVDPRLKRLAQYHLDNPRGGKKGGE